MAQIQFKTAAPRDLHAVRQRFRQVAKQFFHLRRRLEVLVLRIVARTTGIVERLALLDADPDFVSLEVVRLILPMIVRIEEPHRVCGNHRNPMGCCQPDGRCHVVALLRPAHSMQLHVEALWKSFQPTVKKTGGPFRPGAKQRSPHLAELAPGKRNQTLESIRFKPAFEHEYVVATSSARISPAQQSAQVPESGGVRTQQCQTRRERVPLCLGNLYVRADQRLDAVLDGRLVELHHPEDVHAVGKSHGRHLPLPHDIGEIRGIGLFRNSHDPIHEGIFAVDRKVNEATHAVRIIAAGSPTSPA